MKTKRIFFACLAAVSFLGFSSLWAEEAAAAAPAEVKAPAYDAAAFYAALPEAIATCNEGTIVTRAQLLEVVAPAVEGAIAQGAPVNDEMVNGFATQVANSLAMRALLLSSATKAGITGDEAEAKARLEQIKQFATQQGGENAFAEQLKQMGKTEDDLMKMLLEESIIQKYSEKIDAELKAKITPPTEEALKAFYEANLQSFSQPATMHASHILAQFPSQNPTAEEKASTLAKLKDVQAKLAADGSNFADLAKEYSDCPSKENGGDLGDFPKGAMVPEFEAAVESLKEGEITKEPIETMFGYHLIRRAAGKAASTVPFEEAKAQIEQHLSGQEAQKLALKYFEEMKNAAGLKIHLTAPVAPADAN